MRAPRFALTLLIAVTGMSQAGRADESDPCFAVALSPGWRAAARLRLVLENVKLPADQAVKFRAVARIPGSIDAILGTVGIEGISHNAAEARRLPALRIDVTRRLKDALSDRAEAREATICLQAVDGKNQPIRGFSWSAGRVRLEALNP